MSIDSGRMRWRSHILHNRFRNLGRSLRDIVFMSNICSYRLVGDTVEDGS